MVADNKLAELAEIDETELASLLKEIEGQIDPELTGFTAEEIAKLTSFSEPEAPADFNYVEQFGVVVICRDEKDQSNVYERLKAEGLNCKVVVT